MPWLVRDGVVLASLELASDRATRRRGLLGRDEMSGALLIRPARAVHTLGMKFDLDVAYLDGDDRVLECVTMRRNRVGMPRWRARAVIEAAAGAFERWELRPGDEVEVKS
jgi:uncharacterized membrane protein (UPF0127 family)